MRVGPRDHWVGKGQGLPGVARRLPLAPKEDGEKAHHTRICVHDLFGPAAGFKVVNPRVEHVGRYPAQRSTDRTAVERDQAASIRLPFFLERRVAAHVEELAEELVGSCSDTWLMSLSGRGFGLRRLAAGARRRGGRICSPLVRCPSEVRLAFVIQSRSRV
jgi:hypothetical protein